jgi:uncharacterized protein (TIGR01244 family)
MTNTMLDQIKNVRRVSPSLATSGQPSEEQLAAIAAAGFEVVINLALHTDPRYSLKDEAGTIAALGMRYIHIPVLFNNPTRADLDAFFAAMTQSEGSKCWVHCAANYRVTAFLGLYWALRSGHSHEQAFALMRGVWEPDATWATFIADQLQSPHS